MAKQPSSGKCNLCGETFGKVAMTRHLAKCRLAHAPTGKSSKRILHLLVEGKYDPYYWMHIEMPADAKLDRLDDFLRRTWLECCGHLSAFSIRGQRFSVDAGGGDVFFDMEPEEDFSAKLGDVLSPGLKFEHEYDFGTTTHLALKVVAERHGATKSRSVEVLARNDPPDIRCEACGRPATQVCSVCIYNDPAWYCDDCILEHKCGDEYALPVVNSPRVGMCGYTGRAYD
ncbi:MAG: hypothetical protein HY782_00460 [Chloroflexi bacterium]|nr:hypothetical protein [Chloroflexota bacterium]